jgi:hypothetical protein
MGDSQKAIRVTEKLTFVIKAPDVEETNINNLAGWQ